MVKYQLFNSKAEAEACNAKIDKLLGYPNKETKTDRYRDIIDNLDGTYSCGVDDNLIAACKKMGEKAKAEYYDEANLKTYQECLELGFFAPPEGEEI